MTFGRRTNSGRRSRRARTSRGTRPQEAESDAHGHPFSKGAPRKSYAARVAARLKFSQPSLQDITDISEPLCKQYVVAHVPKRRGLQCPVHPERITRARNADLEQALRGPSHQDGSIRKKPYVCSGSNVPSAETNPHAAH